MLLKYENLDGKTAEEGHSFFEQNRKEIMGIYSQYDSMYSSEEWFTEESCALQTMLYLIFGKDEEAPDTILEVFSDIDESLNIEEILQSEFASNVYRLIIIENTLHGLVSKGLVEVVTNQEGERCYQNTDSGNETARQLIEDKDE